MLPETKLIGDQKTMSFALNKTGDLWRGFMPRKSEIENSTGSELYSVEVYDSPDFIKKFNPDTRFTKWAAVKVKEIDTIPSGMHALVIPEGLCAVFLYKGKSSEGAGAYQYIFNTWLPGSSYTLDDRPHLAIMGEKYKNDDPDSEEELWIPIKEK